MKVISENEHGKGYINALKCPCCGHEMIGLDRVLEYIQDETVYATQYDENECPECQCLFSFNIEKMELGEELEDSENKEIKSVETWVWNDYESQELESEV